MLYDQSDLYIYYDKFHANTYIPGLLTCFNMCKINKVFKK